MRQKKKTSRNLSRFYVYIYVKQKYTSNRKYLTIRAYLEGVSPLSYLLFDIKKTDNTIFRVVIVSASGRACVLASRRRRRRRDGESSQ